MSPTAPKLKRHGFFNRFRKHEKGATAIEFALVAPVFFLLLLAIFEASLMLFSDYLVEQAVNEAARTIRTGAAQTGTTQNGMTPFTKATFKKLICTDLGKAGKLIKCNDKLHIDVRKWNSFSAITFPPLTKTKKNASGNTTVKINPAVTTGAHYSPGSRLDIITVSAYYEYTLFTPLISSFWKNNDKGRILTSSTVFRNEPFPDP